jgi:hypothetical protein
MIDSRQLLLELNKALRGITESGGVYWFRAPHVIDQSIHGCLNERTKEKERNSNHNSDDNLDDNLVRGHN